MTKTYVFILAVLVFLLKAHGAFGEGSNLHTFAQNYDLTLSSPRF